MLQLRHTLPALLVSLSIVFGAPLAAQTSRRDEKAYRKTSAELRESIRALNIPQFSKYEVPEAFKSHSTVVLARYTTLTAGSTRTFRRSSNNIMETVRELVKLNDAAAVKQYSELSYTQLRKSRGLSMENTASVFLGVRVIKADGKVTEINTDDIVLTKDEREERQARLAIPDLQPGDMLDYYVAKELNIEQASLTTMPYYFNFFDDVPVLHYEVHCTIGKRFATEYRCYNGAPDFTTGEDEEGSTLLDVTAANLQYIPPGTYWVSPMRQFPVIQLNLVQGGAGIYASPNARRPGELQKHPLAGKIIMDEMIDINNSKPLVMGLFNARLAKKSEPVADYYKALKRQSKGMAADSLAAALYYMFRFDFMFNKQGPFDVGDFVAMPAQSLNTSAYAYLLSEYFKKHDLDAELVLSTSTYGPKMAEVLNKADIRYLCNVRAGHDMLFGSADLYAPAFYLPAPVEGSEGAIAVDTKGMRSVNANNYTQRPMQLGYSAAKDNMHLERLSISPDLAESKLGVKRFTALSGHYKGDIQKNMLLLEDFYNYERAFFNDERSLVERLEESRKSRKVADELNAAFTEARKKQQDVFLEEAKEWLEEEITGLSDARIVNPGVRHTAPSFEYASTFQVNSVLKRAGNNYLLEVGKLIGNPTKVSEAQRQRSLDVYMPYARTVRVEMSVDIPEGYTVEGIESLSKTVRNEAGVFATSATRNGNSISITVEKVFQSSRYAAKDWPALLAVMDAAAEWTGAKLLFRKKAEQG